MYPNPPYAGFSWTLPHHTSYLDPERDDLRILLKGVVDYATAPDFDEQITAYILRHRIFTSNVRDGKPSPFRDYQQLLSQLGLTVSRTVVRRPNPIQVTPLGLSLITDAIDVRSLMTLQVLRLQYPNGHNVNYNMAVRQDAAGVRIRPGVLIWQVLRELDRRGQRAILEVDEIHKFVMTCTSHEDINACVDVIARFRNSPLSLIDPSPQSLGDRRNVQDWIKLLQASPLFSGGETNTSAFIRLSTLSDTATSEIDMLCAELADSSTFWRPTDLGIADRLSWYYWFGAVDLGITLSTHDVGFALQPGLDEPTADYLEDGEEKIVGQRQSLELKPYESPQLVTGQSFPNRGLDGTITMNYDANLVKTKRALHDLMVATIANAVRDKNVSIFHDHSSLDLLIVQGKLEFLVEVKTVTPRNLTSRIRLALGQILHYDYLRAQHSSRQRRRIVGIAASVPNSAWYIDFLNGYMDIDLLSLDRGRIRPFSNSPITQQLFEPR